MAEVRDATVDDVEALLALREEVAAEGRWIGAEVPLDVDHDRRTLTESARSGSLFVVEVDGEIVGMCGMRLPRYLVADLGMMVKESHRGEGVGSALLERAIAWARGAGAHKIALQHWPHNHAAHALYLKYGFEQEGYLRRQYPRRNGDVWDAVVMGLLLETGSADSAAAD